MAGFSFGDMENADYLETLYEAWKDDPGSVDEVWGYFFRGMELGGSAGQHMSPAALEKARKQSLVDSLIYAYRDIGYLSADLDPLGSALPCAQPITLEEYGLAEDDLDRHFSGGHFPTLPDGTLRAITGALEETYCGTIGVEYLHIQSKEVRRWLQEEMEPTRNRPSLDGAKRRLLMQILIRAEAFERFLHTHYIGQKRFSLEGAETLIPALHAVVEYAPDLGIEHVVMGMAHRGRLNVLANILDKEIGEIFAEFEDNFLPNTVGGDGDVKYHLGFTHDHESTTGKACHVSLTANPSHLEVVAPVVLGKVRGRQRQLDDTGERTKVLGLVIHGDAAFSGQGVVAETLNLSRLEGYKTGGTIHVVVNNQIGFTTSPKDARSYCLPTEMAKIVHAPIFHVNGDDPEAVVHVMELAMRFRQRFHRDVVIDMVCYRRHGHNEGDEPSFTQPRMYEIIKRHPTTKTLYMRRLVDEGVMTKEEIDEYEATVGSSYKEAFEEVKGAPRQLPERGHRGRWAKITMTYDHGAVPTGVSRERLDLVARALTSVPDGFGVHPKLRRILDTKRRKLDDDGTVDWAFAESLAYGSLLMEGVPVRLSGQDSKRGTFSQRHAVWNDVDGVGAHVPLQTLDDQQARFCVYNSPLSEVSVLGFEYGYSLAEPNMLIMWEAQFGDFTNGAQVIIDQFVAGAESKWQRSSGLVLLLPHGYEGQGPEHSSAHLERFLQLAAEDNVQVTNPTTPAQYFHLLRRQIARDTRKPLVVMTPKSLLRNPLAVSPIDDMAEGHFREVLEDSWPLRDVSRVVLCSGKVYYDLWARRRALGRHDIAIVRLEQLYPFPAVAVASLLAEHRDAELFWVQEEPKNRGAWQHIRGVFDEGFQDFTISYIGRSASASPAAGSLRQHLAEQEALVAEAIGEERS